MTKNKVRKTREAKGYTQADLAAKTNLSIRTIQRVESGETIPKGHTLTVLAKALAVDKSELLPEEKPETIINSEVHHKVKIINLSALFLFGIPFGNMLIPFFMWNKYKQYPQVDEVGRRIINFQIIWSLITYSLLIISPFLQDFFPDNFTLILWVAVLAACVNVFIIIKTALSLDRHEYDVLPLKWRLF